MDIQIHVTLLSVISALLLYLYVAPTKMPKILNLPVENINPYLHCWAWPLMFAVSHSPTLKILQ